jgi:hypothetical protein
VLGYWKNCHVGRGTCCRGAIGLAVSALDSRPERSGFEAKPCHIGQFVTSLDKMSTRMCYGLPKYKAVQPSGVYELVPASAGGYSPLCGYRVGVWLLARPVAVVGVKGLTYHRPQCALLLTSVLPVSCQLAKRY